jgi:hypothetical protein
MTEINNPTNKFWRYHVRYRIARQLIHMGLWIMPNGRYKDALIGYLWMLYDQVIADVEAAKCTVPNC